MFSPFQKAEALRIYDQVGSVDRTIRILGYPTRRCLYGWIQERSEQDPTARRKAIRVKRDKDMVSKEVRKQQDILSAEEVDELQEKLRKAQMTLDILQEIVRRKQMQPSFTLAPVSQREKTEIIDLLRSKYSLHELLEAAAIDRSAYYYHHNALERRRSETEK
ncbi:MAG: hypothetical protein J5589_08490 [Firmicutes bacterium]|nr:hypothetical protein [Bacillota bacterium]